jgi:hypothetical protein
MSLAYFSRLFDLICVHLPCDELVGDDRPEIIVDPISCMVVAVIRHSDDLPLMPPPRRRARPRPRLFSAARWLTDGGYIRPAETATITARGSGRALG